MSAYKFEGIQYKKCQRDRSYIEYRLEVDGEIISERVLMLEENKKYEFENPVLKTEVNSDEKGVYITLSAEKLARYVCLKANNNRVLFDDNFFDVVPGCEKRVYVADGTEIDIIRNSLEVMTLFDVYDKI